ncbi:hypothetical protein KR074_003606, partial [Drosophila pseudoananassae]
MADPYGPRQQGNYVTIRNEANGQSTCTERSSSQGSLGAKLTQPSGVCLVDFKQLADRDRIVSGEESDYYPYTTFLRNTVVVRSGECCPPNTSFGYPTQRSKSSCSKKDKKSSAHRNSNYQNYDNRSLLGHADENLAPAGCYQPKRKSSRHSCDNFNASNRSKDCSCPPPNPKPRPRPPSNPSNDCGCDPPQSSKKRSRSRSKPPERIDDENCSCPRSGGRRALRSSSSHYMEYKDFRGSSPVPRNRNYSSEPSRKRRKSLTRKASPCSGQPETRGRRKHRTDPPDPSYYTRPPTAAAQQCSVRRHAHAHVKSKCPPPTPMPKGTCRSPTSCKPPPPPVCKNPKCKNNPAKKSHREKKRKPLLETYAGGNGCGLPTDYIVHKRSQQECLRNPVTCSSGHYVRGGVLPHETHFEDQSQCPRKRMRSCDRCNRSIPACSNETMLEKPVQSYCYNRPENGKSSGKCTKCKARGAAEGAGRKCASAVANRCCPLCGVNTVMPKPSIRSMADPTSSRTIYKTMHSPVCRPKKPKKQKYNLTICYTSKNRCLGGKNSHNMTSTLKKRAKAALSRTQFEPLKAIPYMEGKFSVEPKKTEAQKAQADRQPPKEQRSTPDNVTKSTRASTNLRSSLEATKSLRPAVEQPDKSLRSPLVKPEKYETPSNRKEKSLRFPSEEADKSEKTPPEQPDKSQEPSKSRRSFLHELRSDSDGHSGPKSFRSPLNVHTSNCMEALESPRTVQTQMSLPAYRAATYFGTEINPFYRGSFLKVRVSKELLQSHLNPISQRTERTKEEKKPKIRRSTSLSTPSFCSPKNLMRLVFGDPFVRMGANPHYTFSWKKLF